MVYSGESSHYSGLAKEQIMSKKINSVSEPVNVDVSILKPNPLQPRESTDFQHIDSVATDGIRIPLVVGTSNVIYRGHCRHAAAMFHGLETVPCYIIDDSLLSETDKLNLVIDHSGEKPLNKAEAYNAVRHYFRLGFGEAEVGRRCSAILNVAFGAPGADKISELGAEKAALQKHHGTLQNMERMALLPDVVGETYCEFWRNGTRSLTTADIKKLAKSFSEYRQGDPTITRDNPPDAFLDSVEEMIAINGNKVKERIEPTAKMRNKAEIEKLLTATTDRKIIAVLNWVLGVYSLEKLHSEVK